MNIPTKIIKTQIDIITDKKVITEGLKVEASQVALLEKLKIRPFAYKMSVKHVYDNGQIFSANILKISNEGILKSFQGAIQNIASISLATGYITKPAIPHMISNAFRNCVAVTLETDFDFK